MKFGRWLGGAVSAIALVALAGCGSKPAPAPAASTFILPSAAAALTPAVYMELASSSSLFAIRASELALERASAGSTRSAAQAIIADQGGVGSQLSYAGRRLDLLPSATLNPQQTALPAQLPNPGHFQPAYPPQLPPHPPPARPCK